MVTTSRVTVEMILGWKVVNGFKVWIMSHHAGVISILKTDFMIPT